MAVGGINNLMPQLKSGGIPRVSTRFSLSVENGQGDADRTTELVSREHIHRPERVQGNIIFPCSADHEQD